MKLHRSGLWIPSEDNTAKAKLADRPHNFTLVTATITTLATLIGIGGAIYTLRANDRTVKLVNRAYVSIDKYTNVQSQDGAITTVLEFTNRGHTPAEQVEIFQAMKSPDEHGAYTVPILRRVKESGTLMPDGKLHWEYHVDLEESARTISHEIVLILTYNDVFGVNYTLGVCANFDATGAFMSNACDQNLTQSLVDKLHGVN
jgi:hypothetical protein